MKTRRLGFYPSIANFDGSRFYKNSLKLYTHAIGLKFSIAIENVVRLAMIVIHYIL